MLISDPHALRRWPDARIRALAMLAVKVSEHPTFVSRPGDLSDDEVLHAVALSAYFGHLNRIADAVGVPLDYPVKHAPPHAEPAVPSFVAIPTTLPLANLSIAQRPATAEKLAAWSEYVFDRDTSMLPRDRRARLRRRVEQLTGVPGEEVSPADDVDRDLRKLADVITLAPWKITAETYAALRARGFDDAALFDACVVATTAGVTARIAVALAALAR